jgi:hypothetical protein
MGGAGTLLTVLTREQGVSRAARAEAFIETATRHFRDTLAAAVEEFARADLTARDVLGDPREFATRAVRSTTPVASPWDELVGPFTKTEGVQARLGISRQAVAAKAARRRLLRVITADGQHLYPIWQFDGKTELPGLPEVLALFPEEAVDGWTLGGWLRTTDPDLGERPYDALARGDVAKVMSAARSAAAAMAR